MWGNAGGQRSGDYNTPIGEVQNSFSREVSAAAGFGYYPKKAFFSFNYNFNKRRYGIPFDPNEADPEIVELNPRRHSVELRGGFRENPSFFQAGTFSVQYNNYTHAEIQSLTGEIGTQFKNNSVTYQGVFDQRKIGNLSGRFGFWGLHRDFSASGEEALAPPTKHNAFAVFGLQNLDFERVALQFGARLENNRYRPEVTEARGILPDRDFTGFSGAAGIRVDTWNGGALVANYSHSYRAPTLEELYNFGPHPGNLAFEIGDPNLIRERGDGLDFGVRHSSKRVRFEANGFYYHIKDFVFLAPTGDVEDGLIVANYEQGSHPLHRNRSPFGHAASSSGLAQSRSRLRQRRTDRNQHAVAAHSAVTCARRSRAALQKSAAKPRDRDGESPGPAFPQRDADGRLRCGQSLRLLSDRGTTPAQIIAFNFFNMGDTLYRNHLSFIKEFAPEMGRGFRVTYTLRFF